MSRLGSSVLNGGDPSGDPSGPPSPLTASSSPLSEPPEEIDSKEGIIKSPGRPRRSARVDSDPAPGEYTYIFIILCVQLNGPQWEAMA